VGLLEEEGSIQHQQNQQQKIPTYFNIGKSTSEQKENNNQKK